MAPVNVIQIQNVSASHKMALQTFNTETIRPHLHQKNTNHVANNPRIAQSHSPT